MLAYPCQFLVNHTENPPVKFHVFHDDHDTASKGYQYTKLYTHRRQITMGHNNTPAYTSVWLAPCSWNLFPRQSLFLTFTSCQAPISSSSLLPQQYYLFPPVTDSNTLYNTAVTKNLMSIPMELPSTLDKQIIISIQPCFNK